MRDGGRAEAALIVLTDFETRRVPLKVSLADWARGARYAGSKDRAFVSGLALDVLRRRDSLLDLGQGLRGAVAVVLRQFWGWPVDRVELAFSDAAHGPGVLSDAEKALITEDVTLSSKIANVPEFIMPLLDRVSDNLFEDGEASAQRAPFDLRINTLKADQTRVLKALESYGAVPSPLAADGIRLPLPAADIKSPVLTVTPAYLKGWVEVQDEGSQVAALAAGDIAGKQVLDMCAGGGGKTLALASIMGNRGQIYAYDSDAARLAPIFDRMKRSAVRNAQVISPSQDPERLDTLVEKMDLVFVDAPCTGSGTWRRRPDTKWRLTKEQLATRCEEQREVLASAAKYVAPGGAMVYVTCSLFAEENDDQIADFLAKTPEFVVDDAVAAMRASGRLTQNAAEILGAVRAESGTLRLSPRKTATDGFGITRLVRQSG